MDKSEFIELVSHEQEPLRRFLCVLCRGDSFRADDIAQEALLKAWLACGSFEGRSKFSTWLFRIAYRCWCDNRAVSVRAECDPLGPECMEKADEGQPDSFVRQDLYQAICELPDNEQAVILLFYMEDKSIKEISSITGMPSGTVRSHLSRGRSHLRKYLRSVSSGRADEDGNI